MSEFGFKQININNICEQDPNLRAFVKIVTEGQSKPVSLEDYLNCIMAAKLNKKVPNDVRVMFEIVKGTMAYGYFYYPLFSLATEQLFRVTETALKHKCKEYGITTNRIGFVTMIKMLFNKGLISDKDRPFWESMRELRNLTSHPERQMIILPNMAIDSLYQTADRINSLFNDSPLKI